MKKNGLSNEEIASLCREISLLLEARFTSRDALDSIAEECDPAYTGMLKQAVQLMDEGKPLSEALRQTGRFPAYVCGLVEMSESSSKLEEALASLANYYENRARLDRRIRSALLYPAVMLALMLSVIGVLLVKVLPIFDDVYSSLGGRLSGLAGGLLQLGRWLDGIMPVLWVVLLALAVFLIAFAVSGGFRETILARWRKSHGDKGVSRKMNDARLAQALSMGMSCGLPLEEAMDLAGGLMDGVPAAQKRCHNCREYLNQNKPLSAALKESGLLPASQCRLLEYAQRSGNDDTVMAKIAQDLLEDSELSLEEKVSRAEPALVLVCSILVGMILLSVMLPLMHIMSAIG